MQRLLVAYQPYFGLRPHAGDEGVVLLEALGHVRRRVQRGVDLAAHCDGGGLQRTNHVGIAQVVPYLRAQGAVQYRLLGLLKDAFQFGRRHRPRDQFLKQLG